MQTIHPDLNTGPIPEDQLVHQVFGPVSDGEQDWFWLFDADQLAFTRLRGVRRDCSVPDLPAPLSSLPLPGEGWPDSRRPFLFRGAVYRHASGAVEPAA